jgi:hypothetical protein
MAKQQEALEILFGTSNALWRSGTRHEALLLFRSLYAKAEELRAMLCEQVVSGPPRGLPGAPAEEEPIEGWVFEIFSFLRASGLPLSPLAEQRLREMSAAHPNWKPSGREGMSHWMVEGQSDRTSKGQDAVRSLDPDGLPQHVRSFAPEWNYSLRDLGESIGVRIAQDPSWGLDALAAIGQEIATLPQDLFNPILWGIRAAVTGKSSGLDQESASHLVEALRDLVTRLPIPGAWASLPSLITELARWPAATAGCEPTGNASRRGRGCHGAVTVVRFQAGSIHSPCS